MIAKLRSLSASFERLSSREKGLIVGAVGLFVGLVLFFVVFFVNATIGSLEDEVALNRESLAQIQTLAEEYREVTRKQKEIQRLIDENPINSLRIPINTVAKSITVESSDPAFQGRGKRLADLISYGGKTVETRIETKKKGASRKRTKVEDEAGNFEIEQSLEFGEVPIATLYQLLEELKKSDELIFTRRLEVNRRFNNLDHAQASLTVSTIKFREPGGTL